MNGAQTISITHYDPHYNMLLVVIGSKQDTDADLVAETVKEGRDHGIVGDDVQDFVGQNFSPAPGVETVCVFPKNPGKLVVAGQETELLIGMKNVHYIFASLTDAKQGEEGWKDLSDCLSRQLTGLTGFSNAIQLLKPATAAVATESIKITMQNGKFLPKRKRIKLCAFPCIVVKHTKLP